MHIMQRRHDDLAFGGLSRNGGPRNGGVLKDFYRKRRNIVVRSVGLKPRKQETASEASKKFLNFTQFKIF